MRESEETPPYQTHCANTGLSSETPTCKAEWTEVDGGRETERGGGGERERGQWREQKFCSFSRDLARAGWRESVCVGLGMGNDQW